MAHVDHQLGQACVREGLISEDELIAALEYADQHETGLSSALVELGLADGSQLTGLLARELRLPAVDLKKVRVERRLLDLIDGDLACQRRVLPLRKVGRVLTVAMANPLDDAAIDAVKRSTRCDLEIVIADEGVLDEELKTYYGPPVTSPPDPPSEENELDTSHRLADSGLNGEWLPADRALGQLLRGEGREGKEELLAGGMMKQCVHGPSLRNAGDSILDTFISAEFQLVSMSGRLEFRVNGDWPGGHLPPLRDPEAQAVDFGRNPPPWEVDPSGPRWLWPWGSFIRLRRPMWKEDFLRRAGHGEEPPSSRSQGDPLRILFREWSNVYVNCSRNGIDPPEIRESKERDGYGPFDELGRGRETVEGGWERDTLVTFAPRLVSIDPELWLQAVTKHPGEKPPSWFKVPTVSVYLHEGVPRAKVTWAGYLWYVAPRLKDVIPNPGAEG